MKIRTTMIDAALARVVLVLPLLLVAGTAWAGIEEHSPNPGPDFEEWEIISIDLERAREEAENDQEAEAGVDRTVGDLFGEGTAYHSNEIFYRNLKIKWELAPYGLDWVPPSESDLLDGLVPSTLDAPEDDAETKALDEETEEAEENRQTENNEEDLSELDGRLEVTEDGEPMAGCSSSARNTGSTSWILAVFLLGWAFLRETLRLRTSKNRSS